MCGHGHTNKVLNFEDIPGVMGRSNLRAKKDVGGYNFVTVTTDAVSFAEVNPVSSEMKNWTAVKIEQHKYDPAKIFTRPDYNINKLYTGVKPKWIYASEANVISTPAVINRQVVFGNQQGKFVALSLNKGKLNGLIKQVVPFILLRLLLVIKLFSVLPMAMCIV